MNNKASTLQDYSRRLMRVVLLMWNNPDRQYTLEQLADVAHFSPYHFHRIYRELIGETLGATQQRLRLMYAARDLARRDELPLWRVAQRAGYQSNAAFVRSFAAAHGIPPGAYRRQRLAYLQSQIKQELDMYTVQFRNLTQPIHLAALRHHGSYLDIGIAFSQLQLMLVGSPSAAADASGFGLYHDDPATVEQAQLRSDACAEISSPNVVLPEGLQHAQVPTGRYAVIEHVGPYTELEQAYHWLFGVWLPQSGEQTAAVPTIEQYLNTPYDTAPKDLRTEIWLALAN